jgi:hypothetical protein
MAKFSAVIHGMDAGAARKAIDSHERAKKQFSQLRSVMKSATSHGLDRIDVLTYPMCTLFFVKARKCLVFPSLPSRRWRMSCYLTRKKRFRQHQETPFGRDCRSNDVSALLGETYDRDIEKHSEEARCWLTQLQRKRFTQRADGVISTAISTEEWAKGWSKMRESTASAPGSHYGHWKTAAVVYRLPEDHVDYFPELSATYAAMMSLPLKHGFAPKRWCSCIDAIIEKFPGRPIIGKLRIIMLYDADFHFALKLVWGERLQSDTLSPIGLWVPTTTGRDMGVRLRMLFSRNCSFNEFARLTLTSAISVDNDAKSCSDRIIKILAMIACMSVGLILAVATMHNLTHHKMKQRVKSRHGLFRAYFGTDTGELESSSQGSGGSPGIWLIYSVTMLAAFQSFSSGMKLMSPYESLLVVSILAVFFVDDGMPGVKDAADESPSPLLNLILVAEKSAQSWDRLLFASRGALELTKCFAYIIYWDISPSKPPWC